MPEVAQLFDGVRELLTPERIMTWVRVALFLLGGLVVARLFSAWAGRLAGHRFDPPRALLVRRGVYYGVMGLVAVSVLKHLGFDLSVFLGAAGILTVALGFASQTAASNLISGLFLLGERPFQVGDSVQIGDTVGELLSIEWLSVRLRTFDNRLVRIPNEALLKSNIINLTRFPIRRMNLEVPVGYGEDLDRIRELVLELAHELPECLDEPVPKVWFEGFGDSALNLLVVIWARSENFIDTRSRVRGELKKALERAGVEIPFPQRTLTAPRDGRPIPVRMVGGASDDRPEPVSADEPAAS